MNHDTQPRVITWPEGCEPVSDGASFGLMLLALLFWVTVAFGAGLLLGGAR